MIKQIVQFLQFILTKQIIQSMEALRKQNQQLQKSIELLLEEIQKQKEVNSHHENQISTLLNFNQRLLQIIDKEMNSHQKDNCSLQPISERSERQSDLIIPVVRSTLRPRKFDSAAQSERGYPTSLSLIDNPHLSGHKLDIFKMEVQRSELNYDPEEQKSEEPSQASRKRYGGVIQEGKKIKDEMSNEIRQLRDFRNQTNNFYENKIKEVRELGSKLNEFGPMQQINTITQKLNLSPTTTSLLKKVVNKKNQ